MEKMIKIHEITSRYDITARALRYYEDMGLIHSVRSEDYAYRLYDETTLTKLEQILILRKLNISIKDIQRIFNASGSEIVLEVLGKKVQSIEEEVTLLNELKEIVLEFIHEIEEINFNNSSHIKLLFDKAKVVEDHLTRVDYIGKPSNIGRFVEVTQKLEKKPDIRVIELPACRMVTSGVKQGNNHKRFDKMWGKLDAKRKERFFPRDFMWWDKENNGPVWWYAVEDWVTDADTNGFKFVDFEGGMYATAIVPDFDYNEALRAYNGIKDWITKHQSFALDERSGHKTMWHVVAPDITSFLGYRQVEYFFPICIKEDCTKQ
jgi:DNA-binding transcriptional MerR regulator